MNQATDPKHPLREQAIRMDEQLKANKIGWPAAGIWASLFAAVAAIAMWGCG